ncbi:glycosyltransferase N-terminal domain-containing protein, partial [Desulfocurvibacter africanus]
MEGPLAMSIARAIYGLGWTMAMPLLRRHKRLSQGYEQRTLQEPLPEAGLWIQAASGGEAYLAAELLRALADEVPRFTALATTNTAQGLTILEQAAAELNGDEQGRRLYTAFCPFDKPGTMARALFQVRPKVVVLLESELWPGLLTSCRKRGVPVVLVNGRMRPRSLAGYLAAQ